MNFQIASFASLLLHMYEKYWGKRTIWGADDQVVASLNLYS